MDDKLMQFVALATSVASAVAAVLAFAQSGWRSTVRATAFVLAAGGVAYVLLVPERLPPPVPPGGTHAALTAVTPLVVIPRPADVATTVRPAMWPPAASIAAGSSPGDVAVAPALPPAASTAGAGPVPCVPEGEAPAAPVGRAPPFISLLAPIAAPQALPPRYPSVYAPAEVCECPRCRMPFAAAAGHCQHVLCPGCRQVVDLLPAGNYFTIHCCCGNWVRSPHPYASMTPSQPGWKVPYSCPHCGATGTLVHTPAAHH